MQCYLSYRAKPPNLLTVKISGSMIYKYKKQLKITKVSRDGGATKYTNKGSRENDKQDASLHYIFK